MNILVGLFGYFFIAAIHLVVIALDVTLFFLMARGLANKWPVALFIAFDSIGSPVVDRLLRAAKPLGGSCQGRFLAAFLALTVVRVGLVASAQVFLGRVP